MTDKEKLKEKLELYIHIPFCAHKCNYCDFVSFAGCEDKYDEYVDALCKEIILSAPAYKDYRISSIYIGGGTPSILSSEQISKIVKCLYKNFDIGTTKAKHKGIRPSKRRKIRPEVEFSIEGNPNSLTKEKLKTYKKLGINRLSIGLQTTNDNDLKMLGRIHTFEDFTTCFKNARILGFDNINIDLLEAIPNQSLLEWQRTMLLVSTWLPEHISAYSLMIEENTPFYEMQKEGRLNLPDEETERQIYYYTKEYLEKCGYHRYEISNYAKNDFECEHNKGYWRRVNYLGLGLNSSSMINNVRWKNTDNLDEYLSAFKGKTSAMELIKKDEEKLSHKAQIEEYMFLGLRLCAGISKADFFKTFGQDFDFTYGEVVDKLLEEDYITVEYMPFLNEQGATIPDYVVKLTDKGIDFSNKVLAEFLLD